MSFDLPPDPDDEVPARCGSKQQQQLLHTQQQMQMQLPLPLPTATGDDEALYSYVFGGRGVDGQAAEPPPITKQQQQQQQQQHPMTAAAPGDDAPASDHRGCMVVGQYANENELCGGQLFDTGLQGYDGESPAFSSWQSE